MVRSEHGAVSRCIISPGKRGATSHGIALWLFDLDHVRAEVRQKLRAVGADRARHVQHPLAIERVRVIACQKFVTNHAPPRSIAVALVCLWAYIGTMAVRAQL
jgi:hypothetical protein